ncbi:hypothetical protein AB670_01484 [Chryseobacterium sp. MOF25P]|uniref:GLPGLI family protein n=1 Tax=unclassified Chryseobacterium TaxID=2593645 RepID=UPI0008052DE7|nr:MULTISPECIES: GLPGLI family protein [unclassified Chryseobacterium]OBW42146.1 hypothetical protein AB670_01484 [Chryseobacterium sp. MOF25P]OBW46853.1 hypothetical protein AB671_01103 [Chryseobacterium sp. BGARF1]
MKKLGILAVALLAQATFAQTNRFVYQVTSKPDINNKSDIKTENAYLDISADKSMFYSENRIKRDSVMQANRQSGGARGFNRDQMESLRSNINYTIEKNKKDQKITYKDRLGRDQYSYEEDRPLNWKILSETTKIGDYKVQKAETEFGGRKWTAWFTTDLPYQDGPYKFSGLPGLVVKAEDSTGDYSFDLMKNYKISAFPEMTTFGTVMKVKRTDYIKQQEKFKADPMSFLNSQRGGGGISPPRSQGGGGGNQFSPEVKKRIENGVKDEIKKSSNPIELK